MDDKLERYREIYSRGLQDQLPADKKAIADELISRGILVIGQIEAAAPIEQPSIEPPIIEQSPTPPESGLVQQTFNQYSTPLPDNPMFSMDYLKENVIPSVARLGPQLVTGAISIPYNAAKNFTDPVYNALMGKQDLGNAAYDLFKAPEKTIKGFGNDINNLAQMIAAPLGLGANRGDANRAWNDPAAALTAIAPVLKVGAGGVAAAMPKNIPANLTKKSLRFEPTVDPKLQARVADIVANEGAITTKKSYFSFVDKIESQAKKVWELINPVAKEEISPDISAAWNESKIWAETSTDKGKNSAKIDKYFERFNEDHPTLTVEEAQKIKVNLNKDLTNYYSAIAKGAKSKINPEIKAKEQLMVILRDKINEAVPGTSEINSNISDLMTAKPFLKVAMNKSESRQIFGSSDYHAGVIGGFVGGAVNGYQGAGIGGPTAMIASRVLTDQRVQSGAAQAMRSIAKIPERLKQLLSEKEAAKIVADIEPQIPTPSISEITNQLSDKFRKVPAEVNNFERMFQIAQSPEGMKLLMERMGREERYSKAVQELISVNSFPKPVNYPLVKVPDVNVYHVGRNNQNALGQ